MEEDAKIELKTLRADGGAVKNNFLMQFQSDILDVPVERTKVNEATALGAAYLAGLAVGYYEDVEQIKQKTEIEKTFESNMDNEQREKLYSGWVSAVEATQKFKPNNK